MAPLSYAPAAAVAAATIAVLLVLAAAAWYHLGTWTPFTFNGGKDPGEWTPAGGKSPASLRFRDCVFTVTPAGKPARSADVTGILNGMARGLRGSSGGAGGPSALALDRPLNPFSFVIQGFNDAGTATDPGTVPDPSVAPWCTGATATCTTDADCAGTGGGVCGSGQGATGTRYCALCPGMAATVLTGSYRTI